MESVSHLQCSEIRKRHNRTMKSDGGSCILSQCQVPLLRSTNPKDTGRDLSVTVLLILKSPLVVPSSFRLYYTVCAPLYTLPYHLETRRRYSAYRCDIQTPPPRPQPSPRQSTRPHPRPLLTSLTQSIADQIHTMGQSPSKTVKRTRSKELSSSDLADSLASTTISSQSNPSSLSRPDGPSSPVASPGASPPVNVGDGGFSTPARMSARRGPTRKEDRNGSISSFSSANGTPARPSIQTQALDGTPVVKSPQPAKSPPAATGGSSNNLSVPSPPSVPTTTTVLAASPNSSGLRASILGTSPPPSSAIASSSGRPPSPGVGSPFGANRDSTSSLSPGAALSATISRGSTGGSGSGPQVLDVDNMIGRLLEAGYSGKVTKSPPLKNAEIASVCAAAREVFLSQPTLIELSPPVKIVGDVHGQVSIFSIVLGN